MAQIEFSQSEQEEATNSKALLWDAYMILDHGAHDERLAMLDKLKKHFEKVGQPILNRN